MQPEIGLSGSHDRQRGWLKDKYKAEGLAKLIDLELSVHSVLIDIARAAVLGPTALIDDTDPRFQVIDAVEDNPAPGSRKRAGFSTTLSLSRLAVSGSLTTIPTTNSVAVTALALLVPHAFALLWNYLDATIELRGLSADVLVYFEQERLSPAGPALKIWITNLQAASLEVSGFHLNPDPFVIALFNPILNVLLEEVTPALLDRLLRELFGLAEQVISFVEEAAEMLFNTTLAPRSPLSPPNVGMTIQEAVTRGFTVREAIRLQPLLNLNREGEFERLTRLARDAQGNLDAASGVLAALWEAHRMAAEAANISLGPIGFNPLYAQKPIINLAGMALTGEQILLLQSTFDAWNDQRERVDQLAVLVREAPGRFDEFLTNWPAGQTGCEVVNEISGYRIGLAVCRPGAGRALVFPPVGVSQSGDLTLLLSASMFQQMLGDTIFGYQGDPRATDGSPAVLPQLPAIDWWRDAMEPGLLGPRPTDLRQGPPSLPPGPSMSPAGDWRGYWSVLNVSRHAARLVPVHNPAPGRHIAELVLGVSLQAGVTTYTAVTMERCGPDLTRLAGELDRPPLDDPGRFRPPLGPGGPRPRPDRPEGIDVEVGFRRVPYGLEPTIVTARALEAARIRYGNRDGSGELLDIEGALFARPGFGGVYPGDRDCDVITAWDVAGREVWIDASLELRLPVFLGFANHSPTDRVHLADAGLLGARARLPILTYRFDAEPIATGPFALQTAGPLAGLAQGGNRAWLEMLMLNHALALVGNSVDPHRRRDDNPLRYAYGWNPSTMLSPENYRLYAILAMHPTHWSGATPPDTRDGNPPDLRFDTFGTDPDALNLAINLSITESMLDKLGM